MTRTVLRDRAEELLVYGLFVAFGIALSMIPLPLTFVALVVAWAAWKKYFIRNRMDAWFSVIPFGILAFSLVLSLAIKHFL